MKKQMITPIVRVIRYDSESLMNPGSLNSDGGTLGRYVQGDSETPPEGFAPSRYGIFGDSDF